MHLQGFYYIWNQLNAEAIVDNKTKRTNKEAANKAGKTYYMGGDCKRNHGGERYANGGDCVVCSTMQNTTRNTIRLAKDRNFYKPHMIEWVCGFQVQGLR